MSVNLHITLKLNNDLSLWGTLNAKTWSVMKLAYIKLGTGLCR